MGSCAQLYSLAETPQLHPSPRIWAYIRGRYWSAKIDDISLYLPPPPPPPRPLPSGQEAGGREGNCFTALIFSVSFVFPVFGKLCSTKTPPFIVTSRHPMHGPGGSAGSGATHILSVANKFNRLSNHSFGTSIHTVFT